MKLEHALLLAYLAGLLGLCYGSMLDDLGTDPVMYLLPLAAVIGMLAIAPGAIAVGVYHELAGIPLVFDERMLIVAVVISAVVYGALVARAILRMKAQTPYSSAAD